MKSWLEPEDSDTNMQSEAVVCLHPSVKVSLKNGKAKWTRPEREITSRAESNTLQRTIIELTRGYVLRSSLPESFPLKELMRYGILLSGPNQTYLDALCQHYRASTPCNQASSLSHDFIEQLRVSASNERFTRSDLRSSSFEIPFALRRTPSADPNYEFSGLEIDDVERFLRTMHDGENRLYASAGALYPVKIIVEQRLKSGSTFRWFNTATDRVELRDSNSTCEYALDEFLAKTKTIVWLYGTPESTLTKYGIRGYRYMLIEAGHAAQAITNLLNWYGFELRPFGGFHDELARQHLGIDDQEVVLYALGVYPGVDCGDWIVGRQSTYSVIDGERIHYCTSYGGKDKNGLSIYGFGLDTNPKIAELKSDAELAERIALIRCGNKVSNSNGMAAHTSWDYCAHNSALELYERHCVLRTWLMRESTDTLEIPNTSAGKAAKSLAKLGQVEITLKDVTDKNYKVPCIMAIIYGNSHGGVIVSSAAAVTEQEAAEKCLKEISKSLVHRLILRNAEVFSNLTSTSLLSAEDHESYYANSQVAKEATEFLVLQTRVRKLRTEKHNLQSIWNVTKIQDLTVLSPNPRQWKICRATSEEFLVLDFGIPSNYFWERAQRVLGDWPFNKDPHPIG